MRLYIGIVDISPTAAIVRRLRRLMEAEGYILPEIYTPEEMSGE